MSLKKEQFIKLLRNIYYNLDQDTNSITLDALESSVEKNWKHTPYHVFFHDYILKKSDSTNQTLKDKIFEIFNMSANLPMMEEYAQWARIVDKINLSDYAVIAVQHILKSNFQLFKWINILGVPFDRMYIVGKKYSTCPITTDFFKSKGIHVKIDLDISSKQSFHNGIQGYDSRLSKLVKNEMLKALNCIPNKAKRLLIIDDGAIAIQCANDLQKEINFIPIAIEQTRFGSKFIRSEKNGPLNFPVVNVAESNSKLILESPLIGKSIVNEIHHRLNTLKDHLKGLSHKVLVVGYGNIGMAVSENFIKRGYEVFVSDNNETKKSKARSMGIKVVDIDYGLSCSNLIIGCTGEEWFNNKHFNFLKEGFILISGTSSDIEFQIVNLNKGQRHKIELQKSIKESPYLNIHGDYKILLDNKSGWILNSGYPVNFDGRPDPIDPKSIQLTRTLMLAAVCQAHMASNRIGLIEFNKKDDDYIGSTFKNFY